jgi:hypothetical protein
VAIEVDGLTTATTRTWTARDADWQVGAATTAEANAMTANNVALTPNSNKIILGTEQASTSGTSIDYTSIPSGVRRITVMFVGLSTNGTDSLLIQLGDSGGVETTGYVSSSATVNDANSTSSVSSTAGFVLQVGNASKTFHGSVTISLEDATDFTWVASGCVPLGNQASVVLTGGTKSLSAELDRVRITTTGGTNTFDAGVVNIQFER